MRVLADENFDNTILRGLHTLLPDVDIVRVQDVEIYRAPDPVVLEWAAKEERILLTHDRQTMTKHAYDRVKAGLPMPGVIEVHNHTPIGQAIEELAVMLGASQASDFVDRVKYIPIR